LALLIIVLAESRLRNGHLVTVRYNLKETKSGTFEAPNFMPGIASNQVAQISSKSLTIRPLFVSYAGRFAPTADNPKFLVELCQLQLGDEYNFNE